MRSHHLVRFGLACVLTCVLVTGCGENAEDTIPGPNLLDDIETEVVAVVAIDDDGFSEDVLDLEPGQAIEVVNDGARPLRVIGSSQGEQIYDTGELLPAEQTTIAFTTVGRHSFVIEGVAADPLRVAVGLGPTPEPEEPPVTEGGNR